MRSCRWEFAALVSAGAVAVLAACGADADPVFTAEVSQQIHDGPMSPLPGLTLKQELGKKLFFDQTLSRPHGQSCADCHAPSVGWTGPKSKINKEGAVYPGAVHERFGNRKPPSAAYATFSPQLKLIDGAFVGGNFWDGRATGATLGSPAAEQAMGPFLNPVEQNLPSPKALCKLVADSHYAHLFERVWGHDALDCSTSAVTEMFQRIGLSIAAYEGSPEVNAFSSKYDAFLIGKARLSEQERRGLSLFEGKGKCASCHPSPLFTDFTFDNLGVPRNPDNPFYRMDEVFIHGSPINLSGQAWVDAGLGGYLASLTDNPEWVALAEANWGKHKVPTLRNVNLRPERSVVKAYMHNGAFKSLEEVVHFYNTRDMASWPEPEVAKNVNHAELGDLGLSHAEERAIVAFLGCLSDGYRH